MRGGWCSKSNGDEIISVAEYPTEEEFIDANRKDIYSYLINPKSDYANHSDVACFYFDKDDASLEEEGWVKIFRSFETAEAVYSQMRIFLEDHNIKYAYC